MKNKGVYPYLFCLPFLVLFLCFTILPMIVSIVISFTQWDMIHPMEFIGLGNYVRALFVDKLFWQSVWNTFLISFVFCVPLTLLLGLMAAYFFGFKYKRFYSAYQLISLLPYFTSTIAVGVIFSFIFGKDLGVVNNLLIKLGIISQGINWLGNVATSRGVLVCLNLWSFVGYTALFFVSGLSSISNDMIEAARIDGAADLKIFVRICLPNMKNTFLFIVMTSIIGGLQQIEQELMLFNGPFSPEGTTMGGPERSSLTMVLYFYNTAFKNFQYSYAASISVLIAFVVGIFSFVYYVILPRKRDS